MAISAYHVRCKNRYEDQDRLGVGNSSKCLGFIEGLCFNACLVTGNPLHCDESLAVGKEGSAGRRIG